MTDAELEGGVWLGGVALIVTAIMGAAYYGRPKPLANPSEAFLKATIAQSEGLKIQLRAIPWGSGANAGIRNAEEAYCGKFIQDCTLITDTDIAKNYQLLSDTALTGDGTKNGVVVKAFSDLSKEVASDISDYDKATANYGKLKLKEFPAQQAMQITRSP